jgi:hypothetical protein
LSASLVALREMRGKSCPRSETRRGVRRTGAVLMNRTPHEIHLDRVISELDAQTQIC